MRERRREHSKKDRHQSSLSCPIWHHISLCVFACAFEREPWQHFQHFSLYSSYQSCVLFNSGFKPAELCLQFVYVVLHLWKLLFSIFPNWSHATYQNCRLARMYLCIYESMKFPIRCIMEKWIMEKQSCTRNIPQFCHNLLCEVLLYGKVFESSNFHFGIEK